MKYLQVTGEGARLLHPVGERNEAARFEPEEDAVRLRAEFGRTSTQRPHVCSLKVLSFCLH